MTFITTHQIQVRDFILFLFMQLLLYLCEKYIYISQLLIRYNFMFIVSLILCLKVSFYFQIAQ